MNGKILAFGEIMMRLSPTGTDSLRSGKSFAVTYGGTEANVLACLTAFGHETEYLTALPEGELGCAVLDHLAKFGVGTSFVKTGGDTLGIYFAENDLSGSRGAKVIYYRRHSEFTRLHPGSFDTDKIFDGVSLFHISGISFALSASSRELAFELMKEAKKRNIKISFDFNYRPSLWSAEEAKPHLAAAASLADIILAGRRDLTTFLDTDERRAADEYPFDILVLRDRNILSENRHSVKVSMIKRGGSSCDIPERAFPVTERIGGGDAFDGALLHSLMTGVADKEALLFAVTAFALKHTIAGDTFTLKEKDVYGYENVPEVIS